MAPEVSKQENIDWGLALEERLVDEEAGPITSNLQSSNFYFSHPTSVDNAIGASVGTLFLQYFCCSLLPYRHILTILYLRNAMGLQPLTHTLVVGRVLQVLVFPFSYCYGHTLLDFILQIPPLQN